MSFWLAVSSSMTCWGSDEVIELLKVTSQKFHQTIVMITHNPEIAAQADRTIHIEDGRIAE